MLKRDDRVHSLDSLRGIAAIYVVFFHLFLVPTPNPIIPNVAASLVVLFGGTGVFLFFVISGFSLSMTMPRHDRTGHPVISYGISRIFRIVPLFLFMLIVSAFRDKWYFGNFPSLPKWIVNVSFLFNLIPRQQEGIVWASWTIGVEMLFYIAFIPLYRRSALVQLAAGAVALALFTAAYGYAPTYFYWSVIGYFPLFVVGMLSFELFAVLKNASHREMIGLALIAIGIVVLVGCMTVAGAEKNVELREPIGIGYGALLVGCVLCSPIVLKARVLMFFGRISYSIYLVHAPIIYACSGLFVRITAALPLSVSYLACAVVTFAIAIPCAYLCHIAIERPSMRLGGRILKKTLRAIAPAPAYQGPAGSLPPG